LLQRLIANHCVSNKDAQQIFDSLVANGKDYIDENEKLFDEDNGGNGYEHGNNSNDSASIMGQGIDSLETAFVSINKQLKPGFGLEIITMVDTGNVNAKHYHAVVNTTADEIAKKETVFSKSWNPHERAFVRLVMQRLVEQQSSGDDNDDDDSDAESGNKKPSVVGLRRSDLINLRSELGGGFKLTLDQATRAITILLEEKWLRIAPLPDNKKRRESMQATIDLAPRSYMELYHYITGLGMAADKLPQFLYHRA